MHKKQVRATENQNWIVIDTLEAMRCHRPPLPIRQAMVTLAGSAYHVTVASDALALGARRARIGCPGARGWVYAAAGRGSPIAFWIALRRLG